MDFEPGRGVPTQLYSLYFKKAQRRAGLKAQAKTDRNLLVRVLAFKKNKIFWSSKPAMKIIRIYEYALCGTCKDALKFLLKNRYAVEKIDIFTNPPSKKELETMLGYLGGNIKRLFNTTGHLYQEMDLKEKLKTMTKEEAITLLSKNGRLIRRPFVLLEKTGLVGYQKEYWTTILCKD